MKKPQLLKEFLLSAIPELQHNPDRLLIFVDDGKVRNTLAMGLSFEYEYTLTLVLTEYVGDLATISVPVFDWLRVHQSDLLANLEKSQVGLPFEAEILNNGSVDLVLKLPLTERVIVKRQDNKISVDYPKEPQYSTAEPATMVTMYDKDGTQLASWQSVDSELYSVLDVPLPSRGRNG